LCSASAGGFSNAGVAFDRSGSPLGLFVYIALLDIGLLALRNDKAGMCFRLSAPWELH